MRLAFRNIVHDRVRFLLTILGIAFSAFLMMFQGSLLAGFERAASRVIDSIDADLWVMARGVQAFDFAPPMRSDYSAMVRGVDGVESVERIATGIAFFERPNGTRKTVVVIGREAARGLPESVAVDASDLGALGLGALPAEIEINAHRERVERSVRGFGSFLGSPYVFGKLTDARRCLDLNEDGAMFLVLRIGKGSVAEVQDALRGRVPELDVLNKEQFASRARRYWTTQTGAGGALLTAAVLGFLVGVLIVSQTVYATTLENIEEFATLKALGASRFYVIRIVAAQALVSAILGCAAGMALSVPAIDAARRVIPWIATPWQLPVMLAGATLALATLASIAAVRAALTVEPGRVFRA
jgi:putative ABC transport system permease protein